MRNYFIDLLSEGLRPTDSLIEPYRGGDGIVRFVRDVLRVNGTSPKDTYYLAPYQADILTRLAVHKRVAAYGLHGLGKTAVEAWAVLWGLVTFPADAKIITTASVWRQLDKFLWPEIHKWLRRGAWEKVGFDPYRVWEINQTGIRYPSEQREAFAVSTDNPALIEGAHATTIFYLFDESKAIPNGIWDAAEGAFSSEGDDHYALAMSTPGNTEGRFYSICSRKAGYEAWDVRHITTEEAVQAGRVKQTWVNEKERQWGKTSPIFINRVAGRFAEDTSQTLIPLSWVEQAIERWRACKGIGKGRLSVGYDVAFEGLDESTICVLVGKVVESLVYYGQPNIMETVGHAVAAVGRDTTIPLAVDTVGVGAGAYSRLLEMGYNAIEVSGASRTDLTDYTGTQNFVNLRSAVWWALRDGLNPEYDVQFAIPPDDKLIGDLTTPLWKRTSTGLISVESKADMKKRTGRQRSTDAGDAFAYAVYAATVGHSTYVGTW